MILLTKLIAIAFIILGCIVIMKRGVLKTMLEYVKVGNRIYGLAALRILFGIIFIMAAIMGRSGWIVTVLGWLLIVSGVFIFVIKKEKAIEVMDKKVELLKPKTVRLLGTIPVAIGVLLISAL